MFACPPTMAKCCMSNFDDLYILLMSLIFIVKTNESFVLLRKVNFRIIVMLAKD